MLYHEDLDKIAISVKSHRLLKKLLKENPKLEAIMFASKYEPRDWWRCIGIFGIVRLLDWRNRTAYADLWISRIRVWSNKWNDQHRSTGHNLGWWIISLRIGKMKSMSCCNETAWAYSPTRFGNLFVKSSSCHPNFTEQSGYHSVPSLTGNKCKIRTTLN